MGLNVKVGLIGLLDMLKFKNMSKNRTKVIESAPLKEINGDFSINRNARALHPDHMDLVVKEVIDYPQGNAKLIKFSSEEGKALPYFRAGQYVSLKLKIGDSFVTRPYSICSSPKEALSGNMDITVYSNPEGFAADWICENLKEGTKVVASAPEGNFYYEAMRDGKTVIALAGGSGITPFLSMARAIADGIEDFNLTILYGSVTLNRALFKEELEEIAAKCSKVKLVYVLSEEEAAGHETGFITAELIKKYSQEGEYSVFICGPRQMYGHMVKEIDKLGIAPRLVRRELLSVTKEPGGQPGYPSECAGKEYNVTVHQGPNTYNIKASADEPILVAFERAGIKAPSRCRSGECGWCRSKLVSGNVFCPEENEGRRYSDIAHNYIHPCASFPISDLEVEVPGEFI